MLEKRQLIVVHFSCGAASAVAAYKTKEIYGDRYDIMIVNNPVKEEHPDNYRFLLDVQKWLGQEILLATNPDFPENSAVEVWEKRKYMSNRFGAPCTKLLKKESRYLFEKEHVVDWHVLGFTADEKGRHERFIKSERENVIPVLIDLGLTKEYCFDILLDAGLKLPEIYNLGYPNANCIGCVKASSPTYWNHVRIMHPLIFNERAEQSRRLGAKLVRYKGKRIYLDELPEDAVGRKMKSLKSFDCSIFCQTK